MMLGTVNIRYEILIQLPIYSAIGSLQEIETVLDTGFSGALTLPSSVIASFGLPWHSRGNAILANGNIEQFDLHAATVVWDGKPRQILVQAIDTPPLIGMALLVGYDLRVQVIGGGTVEIEPIA